MHLRTIFFCLLVTNTAIAQTFTIINGDTVNRKDKWGRKQGKWVEQDEYGGGNEYHFVNNKKDGPFRYWWKGNTTDETGSYKNGKQEGSSQSYLDGKLYRTNFHHLGHPSAQSIEYFSNGRPKNSGNYFNGNGVVINYDSTGNMIDSITYHAYRKNGSFSRFYPGGHLREKGIYKDNKYWTLTKRFFDKGDIDDCSNLTNGNGRICVRNDSGHVTKIEVYRGGLLWNMMRYRVLPIEYENIGQFKNGNGIVKEYNDTGEITAELHYKNGRLNGPCKYYYRTVVLAGECINDRKEGKWVRYDRGRIRNLITFKNDREYGIACF